MHKKKVRACKVKVNAKYINDMKQITDRPDGNIYY